MHNFCVTVKDLFLDNRYEKSFPIRYVVLWIILIVWISFGCGWKTFIIHCDLLIKTVKSQMNSFWRTLRVIPYRVTHDEPVLVLEILGDQRRNQSAGWAGDDDIVFTETVYLSVDASLQIQVLVHAFLSKRARQTSYIIYMKLRFIIIGYVLWSQLKVISWLYFGVHSRF